MTRRTDDYETVSRLLHDLCEVKLVEDGEMCARTVIDTGEFRDSGKAEAAADEELAEINAALAPDFLAAWSGSTTGDTGWDVLVEYIGPDQSGRYDEEAA